KRLFAGDDDLELMRLVRKQPMTPPSRHNPDVPPELDAIVKTALERDPELRWLNAPAKRNALLVDPSSSNAAIVEWVEWVFSLGEGAPKPVRAVRPLPGLPPAKPVAADVARAPTALAPGAPPARAPTMLPVSNAQPVARAPTTLPVSNAQPV